MTILQVNYPQKVAEGTGGDTNKRFDFIVTFTGDEEGYYYYEGRAGAPTGIITSGDTISLAHGENITICGLPEGVEYEVKEADYSKDGYTVVSTGESGTIDEDEDKLALFINTRNSKPNHQKDSYRIMVRRIENLLSSLSWRKGRYIIILAAYLAL